MAVSVDVAGKLVVIDDVFKDRFGSVVDTPAGATYEWSVADGGEFVTMEADNAVGKVTPVTPGTATVSLTMSGGGLASSLTGTLEVTVVSMEPASVELNGTVIDAVYV